MEPGYLPVSTYALAEHTSGRQMALEQNWDGRYSTAVYSAFLPKIRQQSVPVPPSSSRQHSPTFGVPHSAAGYRHSACGIRGRPFRVPAVPPGARPVRVLARLGCRARPTDVFECIRDSVGSATHQGSISQRIQGRPRTYLITLDPQSSDPPLQLDLLGSQLHDLMPFCESMLNRKRHASHHSVLPATLRSLDLTAISRS